MSQIQAGGFASFREFYPFYLGEHSNRTCRRLHFAGTSIALALFAAAIATRSGWLAVAALLQATLRPTHDIRCSEQCRDASRLPRAPAWRSTA